MQAQTPHSSMCEMQAGRSNAANIPNGLSASAASKSSLQGAHASPDSHTSSHLNGVLGYPNNGMPENVWAACGFPLAGANGWVMYRVQETEASFLYFLFLNSLSIIVIKCWLTLFIITNNMPKNCNNFLNLFRIQP